MEAGNSVFPFGVTYRVERVLMYSLPTALMVAMPTTLALTDTSAVNTRPVESRMMATATCELSRLPTLIDSFPIIVKRPAATSYCSSSIPSVSSNPKKLKVPTMRTSAPRATVTGLDPK